MTHGQTRLPKHRRDDRRATGSPPGAQPLFAEAVRHHQAGRLGAAEQLYRQILAVEPRNADGLHLLGVVACQTGRHAVAIDLIGKAIRLRNDVPDYHSNLGNALQGQGRLADAIARYRRAIVLKPDYADAHNNLGNALQRQGKLAEAAVHYRRAIDIEPNYLQAHNSLANVLKAQDKLGDARVHYERAIALKPDAPELCVNLGNVLHRQGRFADAASQYERAIVLQPDHADAYAGLGSALEQQGRADEAVAQYERALALDPDAAEVHVNLGNVLQGQGRLDAAARHYGRAIALRPAIAEAHNNLGNVFREQNRPDEAVAQYQRAIALKPDYAEAHSNLGNAYVAQGRAEAAQHAYQQAIHHSARTGVYYRHLFYVRRAVAGDPGVAAMEKLAQDMPSLPAKDQKELHFALGKAYADLGEHERAFRHLLNGNLLKRRELVYDEAAVLGMLSRIQAVFTPELMHARRGAADPSPVPVFIVGMPRSGTTLVEQILASHPKVFGAGERRELEQGVAALRVPNSGLPFPEIVPDLSDDQLRRLGAGYLAAVGAGAPWAARITDKMPANFSYLGLIRLALPNARIIHVRRDPIDTCLSCFALLFEVGQPYSYDLGELGRYYRAYAALMEHWRRALPAATMLEVRYEDIVADVEHQARRIVAHCGLEWDDACLAFYGTQRPIWTASATQVRQPIYRTSVGRRAPYLAFLWPLMRELGLAGAGSSVIAS
ncbi:MAG TPA: tetratricopeptide repeat protein [Acetobacteraceae bacterium]|jgi:tetratricopeptide (TPR) repeat protein